MFSHSFLKLEEFLHKYCQGPRASADERLRQQSAAAMAFEGALPTGSSGTRVATVVRRGNKVGLADSAALWGHSNYAT